MSRPLGWEAGGAGVLRGARFVTSPNCDDRPDEMPIDLLVVHAISLPPGEFDGPGIEALFTTYLLLR